MESKQIATVANAHIGVKTKDNRGRNTGHSGVCLTFVTDEALQEKTLVSIADHWFKVHAININEDNKFEVEVHEVGYYDRLFNKDENFDMRTLLGKEVLLVLDQKTKNKVYEESCWC